MCPRPASAGTAAHAACAQDTRAARLVAIERHSAKPESLTAGSHLSQANSAQLKPIASAGLGPIQRLIGPLEDLFTAFTTAKRG
jgi:hypothetical protein